jgi:Alpha/beta hydrolase
VPPLRIAYRAVAAVMVLSSTAAAPNRIEPYQAPAAVPALSGPASLDARFAAVERNIRSARATAVRARDDERAATLSRFLAPGRRFLAFDPRRQGRAVEVIGDLERADRVAVIVPGADGLLTNFDSPKWVGGDARALYREAAEGAAGTRFAVVAWLGYDSPSTRSPAVLTEGRADDASRELARFLTGWRRVNGRAEVALLCHSYGAVVCAKAAPHAPGVDDIALYGSPGVNVRTARDLKTSARVWVGRSSGDWTRFVPKVRLGRIGFGHDPAGHSFGARRFETGDGPHSAYLRPGSVSLRNLSLIALGRGQEVTDDRP